MICYEQRVVLQFDQNTGEIVAEYPSASEAAQIIGVTPAAIRLACRRVSRTSKGFVWRYEDDAEDVKNIPFLPPRSREWKMNKMPYPLKRAVHTRLCEFLKNHRPDGERKLACSHLSAGEIHMMRQRYRVDEGKWFVLQNRLDKLEQKEMEKKK